MRIVLSLIVTFYVISSVLASDGVPVGHLLPLGGHRKPDAVEERYDFPSAEEFMENYVRKSKHVVFKGAAKKFPAFKLWTEEYLKQKYSSMELRLEAKKEKQGYVPVGAAGIGRDTLGNFIDIYHSTNRYIVSELPLPMWNEVSVLPCMTCGMFKDRFVEVDIWMSGGDSSSIVHKDAFNTMNCLLNGTKEWKFIDYKYEDKIYKAWEPDNQIGGFSKINPEAVDLLKYPLMKEVPWSYSKLEAGDCVFLPGSMYHQVKSFGSMNVAVALLFSRFKLPGDSENHNFKDCNKDTEAFTPLSHFDVDWQYPGVGKMSMGNSELSHFSAFILEMTYKGKVSKKRIKRHVNEVFANRVQSFKEQRIQYIYDILTAVTKSRNLTADDVNKLNKVNLRVIGDAMQPDEPSNTYEYEFSYVNGREIGAVVKQLVKEKGTLNRDDFIKAYQEECLGTEKFANMIFYSLGGSEEKDSLTKEELMQTIQQTLAPFNEDRSTDFYRDDPRFDFGDAYDRSQREVKQGMSNEEWEEMGTDDDEGEETEGEDSGYEGKHEEDSDAADKRKIEL